MISIQPLQEHQIPAVKGVIAAAWLDIWPSDSTPAQVLDWLEEIGELSDVDQAMEHYARRGQFLVLLDGDRVVGCGGVRRLDDAVCELKRMWFQAPYRGRGLGRLIAERLIAFARSAGYTKMRLDCGGEKNQAAAMALYRKLGFFEIERYNDGLCDIFMEKEL